MDNINFKEFEKKNFAGDFYLWYNFAKENKLYIVNSNLGGFRFKKNQLSEDSDAYSKEFQEIIGHYKPNSLEKKIIFYLRQAKKFCDNKKLKKNPDIVRFNLEKNSWELGNN